VESRRVHRSVLINAVWTTQELTQRWGRSFVVTRTRIIAGQVFMALVAAF
jgi:hypothetical protein